MINPYITTKSESQIRQALIQWMRVLYVELQTAIKTCVARH